MGSRTNIDDVTINTMIREKYVIENNTFSRIAKPDWCDKLDVEVGDAKQPEFYPQVKVKRWDNEVNFSVRLMDDETDEPVIGSLEDKVTWDKLKKSIKFYELPETEDHPEGGYEFEITLKEKPVSNVVRFTMQTKGLEFLYQPALTEQELKDELFRPDNVVGSYAVYYKDCPNNYVGKKLYKTGKAFHIYRPKIQDANGNTVWGEINVDEKNGLLTVTIPQEFLEAAAYPITHAAGLTIGFSSVGATRYTVSNGSARSISTVTFAPVSGTLTNITVNLQKGVSGTSSRTSLHDSSYQIVTPISGIISNPTSQSWLDFPISSGPTLSANSQYWITTLFGTASFYCYVWYDDMGSGVYSKECTATFSTIPTDISSGTNSAYKFSMYATYTVPDTPIGNYTDTYATAGTGYWYCPKGVTKIKVEVWGAGGAGGGQNSTSDGGGGGGGGAYARVDELTVIPETVYNVGVGSPGAGVASSKGGDGAESRFSNDGNTVYVYAGGGTGGSPSTGTPPAGGAGSTSKGASTTLSASYNGGNGGKGRDSSSGYGAYGGSSAGIDADGFSGPTTWSSQTYPSGSTPSGAGVGGHGGITAANGNAPASGNGGGGGGSGDGTAMVGGNGAPGKLIITYTVPAAGPAGLGTDMGLVVASIQTIMGLAIASISSDM
jgi:hypothetical protein